MQEKNIKQLSENQFAELVYFIRNQIREDEIPITRETLIEDNLGVTGDEAEELIRNFAKTYNINIDNFVFMNYFFEEPNIYNSSGRTLKPFTVGHMEKAIIVGRLDENVING